MLVRRLKDLFFPSEASSTDKDLYQPMLGESRPRGHFREFTVPRRLQQGGLSLPATRRCRHGRTDGIIPVAGENIP